LSTSLFFAAFDTASENCYNQGVRLGALKNYPGVKTRRFFEAVLSHFEAELILVKKHVP